MKKLNSLAVFLVALCTSVGVIRFSLMKVDFLRVVDVKWASRANIQGYSSEENTTILTTEIVDNAEYVYSYNETNRMLNFAGDYFHGHLCERILTPDSSTTNIVQAAANLSHTAITIHFNCNDLYANSSCGTGNFISAIYGLRLAAATIGNVDVVVTCEDAYEQQGSLILPWIMGWFPRTLPQTAPADRKTPGIDLACSDYNTLPIGYLLHEMRFEMRRMAIALVGIPPYQGHPAQQWAEQNLWSTNREQQQAYTMQLTNPARNSPPIFPDVELDDAVLHFRCGDLIAAQFSTHGFMKFESFSRHLFPNVTSIGIVTQPFDVNAQVRLFDGGQDKRQKCKLVVFAFVDHLRARFPKARITVRNDPRETIALTFARMIMTRQTVIGITSFGVFPGVSTFGTGYIRKPDFFPHCPNLWLLDPNVERTVNNVKLIEEPRLMAFECAERWGTDGAEVLQWFRNYTV
jgi:hypothetical protein